MPADRAPCVLQMGDVDKDTLAQTLERVSSLVINTEESREGSALPSFSLPERPELPEMAELHSGALVPAPGMSQFDPLSLYH